MATAPNQGIMALPENQEMQAPQLSLMDSYEAMQQGMQNARPDASMELEEVLAEIRPELDELDDEQLALLIQGVEGLYGDPKNYAKEVADLVKEDLIDEGDFPAEYDEEFLAAFLMVLIDAQRGRMASSGASQTMPMPESSMGMAPMGLMPPQGFARGGIAEAARMVANRGRYGDTMLAHITPEEARLLRSRGGAGTINPETGLPEFFIKKLVKFITQPVKTVFKAVKKHVKNVGNLVKKALSSPIGRILGTIALGMVLGPAVTAFLPGLSAGMAAGVTGALASGGVSALSGGDLKSILTSAATGFIGAPGGPVGNFVGKYTAQVGITNAAANAAITGTLTGTGAGLISGQNFKEALKSGLVEGAISGGTALMSGAPKVDVDNAATTAARDAVESGRVLPDVDSKALDVEAQDAIKKFKSQPNMKGAAGQADTLVGTNTRPINENTAMITKTFGDGRVTEQLVDLKGVPLLDEQVITQGAPRVSAAPTQFGIDAPFPGSDVRRADGTKGLVLGEGVGQAQMSGINPPIPPVSAAPTQFGLDASFPGTVPRPTMDMVDQAQGAGRGAATNIPIPSRSSANELLPSLDYAGGVQLVEGVDFPYKGQSVEGAPNAPAPYRQVGVMESLGEMGSGAKKFLTGDFSGGAGQFAEGVGNLFAPGPSAEQVDEFMMARNMPDTPAAYDRALKRMGAPTGFTGALRTYGPTAAAGIGALALTGGFEPKPQPESELGLAQDLRRPIDLSGKPRDYYVQDLPGVKYDEFGAITGTMPPPPAYTMDDIRVGGKDYLRGNYRIQPYPMEMPLYMNEGGAVPGKQYINRNQVKNYYADPRLQQTPEQLRQSLIKANSGEPSRPLVRKGESYISPSARSIDYGDPYAIRAPMPVVNRYYPLVSNTPAPKKRYAGQPRTPEEMRQDLEAGRYSQSRFVPRNTSVVPGKSLLPSPAPARMNVGGIAALTQGGYPRRTGQISGPGTEKSDSIPAMLSDGEFVMTAKAVRGAGGGSRREGAKRMYALMNQLERNAARG